MLAPDVAGFVRSNSPIPEVDDKVLGGTNLLGLHIELTK